MKVKSWTDEKGNVYFNKYVVIKQSENFYGVYEKPYGGYSGYYNSIITSGTTKNSACKKAKLLQIGFDNGFDYAMDY